MTRRYDFRRYLLADRRVRREDTVGVLASSDRLSMRFRVCSVYALCLSSGDRSGLLCLSYRVCLLIGVVSGFLCFLVTFLSEVDVVLRSELLEFRLRCRCLVLYALLIEKSLDVCYLHN